MSSKFELLPAQGGKFRFCLKAANNIVVLTSQTYNNKRGALNGIESVRTNARKQANFEVRTAKDGRPYFVLLAANKQIIGQSQMYASAASMRKGIASVQTNAPKAEVVEIE